MQSGVSGWYARLDRCLGDRTEQIHIWLAAWEQSLLVHQPIAALLPEDWPTLPANLLTDPGHVLDHLLARHDAEADGEEYVDVKLECLSTVGDVEVSCKYSWASIPNQV